MVLDRGRRGKQVGGIERGKEVLLIELHRK